MLAINGYMLAIDGYMLAINACMLAIVNTPGVCREKKNRHKKQPTQIQTCALVKGAAWPRECE